MNARSWTAAACAALAVAACGESNPPPAAPPPTSAAPPAAQTPVPPSAGTQPPAAAQAPSPSPLPADQTATPAGAGNDPRVFLLAAASAGMLEVAASRMALEKATNPAIKGFAEHMVADHGKSNEALKALAATKNVTLGDALQPVHQAELDTLRDLQGAAFDQAYAQRIGVQAHMSAVTLFEAAAKGMEDPEVKAFATATLPTLREHLDRAQQLNQAVAAKS